MKVRTLRTRPPYLCFKESRLALNANPKSSVTTPTEKDQLKQMETSMTFSNVLPEKNAKNVKIHAERARGSCSTKAIYPKSGPVLMPWCFLKFHVPLLWVTAQCLLAHQQNSTLFTPCSKRYRKCAKAFTKKTRSSRLFWPCMQKQSISMVSMR